jgi:hypothetical protein
MTVTSISVGSYLSDIFPHDLPSGVYLNKVMVGCGATHSAITNCKNYVILVPYINLVKSKCKQHPHLIGVHGGVSVADMCEAIYNGQGSKKIICTYDSLPKVMRVIDSGSYKLLIDESHSLVDFSQLKPSVCQFILDNYKKFGEWLFVSATPTKAKYLPDELAGIPIHTLNWVGALPVNMKIQHVKSLDDSMISLCNTVPENLHFFTNDTMAIRRFMVKARKLGYTRDSIRVVMSTSGDNEMFLSKSLSRDWSYVNDINDDVCKVNIYTSTAFVGCDIYDKTGKTYICVDGDLQHSKLDMTSTIPQIIGRLRDSIHKSSVHLLMVNPSKKVDMTEDEYMDYVGLVVNTVDERIKSLSTQVVAEFAAGDDRLLRSHRLCLVGDDGQIQVNQLGVKFEMQRYLALHAQYVVREEGSGEHKTITELLNSEMCSFIPEKSLREKTLTTQLKGYSLMAKSYIQALKEGDDVMLRAVAEREPDVIEHYNLIGEVRMKACNYRRSLIEQEAQNQGKDWSQFLDLNVGGFYANTVLKELISQAYHHYNITKKAKATDVLLWFNVTKTTVNKVHGYRILSRKTMIRGKECV